MVETEEMDDCDNEDERTWPAEGEEGEEGEVSTPKPRACPPPLHCI